MPKLSLASVLSSAVLAAQGAAGFSVSLTYRYFVEVRTIPATGQKVETWHEVPIPRAILSEVTSREVAAAPSMLQITDVVFLIVETFLAPHRQYAKTHKESTDDQIRCEDVLYRVIAVAQLNALTRLTARVI